MRAELIQLTAATLGRAPSPQEMTSWLAQLENGSSLDAIAQDLMFNEGGIGRFAGVSNTAILVNAYQALFGRLPDTAGLNYWLNEFNAGRVDLGNLIPSLMAGAVASTGNPNDALILAARAQAAANYLEQAEESGSFSPQAAAAAIAAIVRSSVAEPSDEPSNLYNPNDQGGSDQPESLTLADAIAASQAGELPDTYVISDIATVYDGATVADLPDAQTLLVINGAENAADYTYSLSDVKAHLLDPLAAQAVTDADSVVATDALTAAEAVDLYALNNNSTYTVEDSVANILTEYQTDTAPFTNATSWTLTDGAGSLTPSLADAEDTAAVVNGATNAGDYTIDVSDTAGNIETEIGNGADLSGVDSIEHTSVDGNGSAQGVSGVADTFVFGAGAGATISGFTDGEDVIDLQAIATVGPVTFEALGNGAGYTQVAVTDNAGDAEVAFDISDDGVADFTITLAGFAAGSVDATDFVF